MHWFQDLRLGIKLNLPVVGAIAFMALIIFASLFRRTETLMDEVGRLRITQEISVVENQFTQAQESLQSAAALLANTPNLIDAIATNQGESIRAIALTSLASFQIDDFDVINAEGMLLFTFESEFAVDAEQEAELLNQTLFGIDRLSLRVEENDDVTLLRFVLVRPVRGIDGEIVGGILLARELNDDFLTDANLNRQGIELGLVYNGEIIAQSRVEGVDASNFELLSAQGSFVTQALNGTTVLHPNTLYLPSGVPTADAYVPIKAETDLAPHAVVVVRVINTEIANYRWASVTGLGTVLTLLTIILVTAVVTQLYFTVTRRIDSLRKSAMQLGQGDYSQRSNIKGRDEIGQLAHTFDQMAEQIQKLVGDLGRQVTEAEAARAQAERSDQVKSSFLASMSHELRTPLNSIINFTKFVAKGTVGPVNEEQELMLTDVIDSAKHLLGLINDVLDMSKIESGSLKLFVEDEVDLNVILDAVVSTGKSLLVEKPVTLETVIDHPLPSLRADRQRILQILLNIMSNACKFTEEGYIMLSASQRGDEIEISVQDTGPGIGDDDHTDVFEAFKQTHTGLRQGGGTGLGMPITRSLVEAHGGRLWFESVVGKGTTFFVRLPLKSDALTPVNLSSEEVK